MFMNVTFKIYDYDGVFNSIMDFIQAHFGVNSIDYSKLDIKYLTSMLGSDLLTLKSACAETVDLNDLRCFDVSNKDGISIENSRYYLQLKNNQIGIGPQHINNYTNQTNKERFLKIYDALEKNGYDSKTPIIVYNDDYVIRDGEHRAAILCYLHGNTKIEILRLKFKGNNFSFELYHSKKGKQ